MTYFVIYQPIVMVAT